MVFGMKTLLQLFIYIPIHTMLYCIEYCTSHSSISTISDSEVTDSRVCVCDLTSADTVFFSSVRLCLCRRLCSIMSWVAESSSEIPPDVSRSMTLCLWMLMRQISCESGPEKTCDLQHTHWKLWITPRASLKLNMSKSMWCLNALMHVKVCQYHDMQRCRPSTIIISSVCSFKSEHISDSFSCYPFLTARVVVCRLWFGGSHWLHTRLFRSEFFYKYRIMQHRRTL